MSGSSVRDGLPVLRSGGGPAEQRSKHLTTKALGRPDRHLRTVSSCSDGKGVNRREGYGRIDGFGLGVHCRKNRRYSGEPGPHRRPRAPRLQRKHLCSVSFSRPFDDRRETRQVSRDC